MTARFWRWLRRQPPRKLLAVLLLLGLIGTALGFSLVQLWAEHQLAAAERHLRAHQLEQAQASIDRVRRVWPHSGRALLLAARIARHGDRYEEADELLGACRKVLGNAEALQTEELLLSLQRGEATAQTEALVWRLIDGGHAERLELLEAMTRGWMLTFRLRSAVQGLNRWLEERPDEVRALFWRGWVLEKLHQSEPAERDYRRALELDADHGPCRLRLANLLLLTERPDHARRLLEEHLRREPGSTEATVSLALALDGLGRTAEARRLLRAMLAEHPDHALGWRQLGKLSLNANDLDEAGAALARAYAEAPQDAETVFAYYQYLEKAQKKDEATRVRARHDALKARLRRLDELITKSMEQAPHDPDLMSEIGVMYLEEGRAEWHGWALWWLSRALERDPLHRRTHEALARHYEKTGQPDLAERHRKAAQLRAKNK
jgi:predicted Zn-dependent protease